MPFASCCLLFLPHVTDLSSACSSLHVPGTGAPRALERKEAHPWLEQAFDEAMILLNEIVEVVTLPQFAKV